MFKALIATNDIDANGAPVPAFTDTSSWALVKKGYPTSWLSRLAEGVPLIGCYSNLVDVNSGASLIPTNTHTSNTFTYSMKCKQWLPELYKDTDNNVGYGTQWAQDTINRITINNTISISDDRYELRLLPYTASNLPLQTTSPKPVTYVEPKCVMTDSHSVYRGAGITNMLGGIATSDELVTMESKVLENCEIKWNIPCESISYDIRKDDVVFISKKDGLPHNGVKNGLYLSLIDASNMNLTIQNYAYNTSTWKYIGIVTTPTSKTPTLTSSTSKASKLVYTTATEANSVFDQVFVQELATDANSVFNASTEFDNLTNGTTLDDVGTTVKTGVFASETPLRVHK